MSGRDEGSMGTRVEGTRFTGDRPGAGTEKDPDLVSVVIPTLNSESTLERCLQSVRAQTYGPLEVLVLDGGSRDNTMTIGRAMGASVHSLPGLGMAAATNRGIQLSRGNYLLRLDSDVLLSPTTIEECVSVSRQLNLDALCVYWAPDPSVSYWARVKRFEAECYRADLFPRGARFFRRQVIEAIGGFNPDLVTGEDYDVYNRLVARGFRVGRIKSVDTHIGEPRNLAELIQKNYRYGMSVVRYLKTHPEKSLSQLGPPVASITKCWREFARQPFMLVGYTTYVIAKYSSASAGMLAGFLHR